MLKDCVKVLKNKDKISGKEFGYIFLAGTSNGILQGNLKVHRNCEHSEISNYFISDKYTHICVC